MRQTFTEWVVIDGTPRLCIVPRHRYSLRGRSYPGVKSFTTVKNAQFHERDEV